MIAQDCLSIKEAILAYMESGTHVSACDDACIVSLPLKTADDRFIDVYIERKASDFFLVHDCGKTLSELKSQGINVKPHLLLFEEIAKEYGASLSDSAFVVGCKIGTLQKAILAIAQCASLAMLESVKHKPSFEEEPLVVRVERVAEGWGKDNESDIRKGVSAQGTTTEHKFDLVAFPRNSGAHVIAISVLTPTYTPMTAARQFGFLAYDITGTMYARWRRLAILAKSEAWSAEAVGLVRKHATRTLDVRSANPDQMDPGLMRCLSELKAG